MNFGRLAAAAVVAWLSYLAISPVANTLLLADQYSRHAAVFRPAAEMNLVLGFAATFAGFFVFAYAYAKGYEGGPGMMEGLRFGVLVGLLLACFGVAWNYVVLPISPGLALAWIVDTIAEMAIYGAIVGLVYKPVPGRR